jgi:hypothetical protein
MRLTKPHRPGAFLLGSLVAGICVVPETDDGTQFVHPLGAAILVTMSGISAWRHSGRGWGLAVLAFGWAAIGLVTLTPLGATPGGHMVPGGLLAVSFVLAAIAVVRAAVSPRTHGIERIYYGLAAYMLIGIAFASVQQRVSIFDHGAYRLNTTGAPVTRWVDFLWLSFSTLTTAGFGDVVPVSNAARMICTLEAVTGVMFPAIFLARLVTAATEDDERDDAARKGTHGT